MPDPQIWLLHLSDIHFCKKNLADQDPYDLDADLRDQIEADVLRLRASVSGIHGIVVSGDIAFGAREPEYETALTWLQKLCDLCGCPHEAVWCVPGNHDIDRSVYDNSLNLRNLHSTLRPTDPANVDPFLGEALRDREAANTLLRPFQAYNRFASKFRCPTHPGQLAWEHRMRLNDGSTLVLRGANSALVSHLSDNNRDRKLILGTLQATPKQRPDEAVVFVCHHPLDWLHDYDQLIPILNARARAQLFGHKHMLAVELTNNCLRLVAGAVHPSRREPNWKPRYNCIGFSVSGSGHSRKLDIDLYPRVWSTHQPKFVADYDYCDGKEHKLYQLALDPWEPPHPTEENQKTAPGTPSESPAESESGAEIMDPAKTLTYRFLSLPHLVRVEIAQEMHLLREEDEGLLDDELLERVLRRARDQHRLAELWSRVEARYGRAGGPNPYSKH